MNRATQLVSLWIDNDEYLLDTATEIVNQDYDYNIERASALKEFIESTAQEIAPAVYEASFVADLFQYAMADVEWNLITDSLRESSAATA